MPGLPPSPTAEHEDIANDVLQVLNGPPGHLPDDLPDLLLQDFHPVADNPIPPLDNDQPPVGLDNDLNAADDLEII